MLSVLIEDVSSLKELSVEEESVVRGFLEAHIQNIKEDSVSVKCITDQLVCNNPECTDCVRPPDDTVKKVLESLDGKGFCHFDSDTETGHLTAKGGRMAHLTSYISLVTEANSKGLIEKMSAIMESGSGIEEFMKRNLH